MTLDEEQMNFTKYEDLKCDNNSSSEVSTECFSDPFIPDANEGKYSNHGLILQHFLSKCFDDNPDPDLDLETDDIYTQQSSQENDQIQSLHTLSKNIPPPLQ